MILLQLVRLILFSVIGDDFMPGFLYGIPVGVRMFVKEVFSFKAQDIIGRQASDGDTVGGAVGQAILCKYFLVFITNV